MLNLWGLFDQYEFEPITQNDVVREDYVVEYETAPYHLQQPIDISKNLLICDVKKDH